MDLTNLVVAGLELLLPVAGVSLHGLHPLGQLLDLGPEVGEGSMLGRVSAGGGANLALKDQRRSNCTQVSS